MRTILSLIAALALGNGALFAEDRRLVPAKVLGERTTNQRTGGTAIGNVILNVPIPSAPNPTTSRNPTQTPPASPVPAQRIVLFEVGDFIYEMEQIGGQRFPVIPDEKVDWYQEKGKYVVLRLNKKYEFAAIEFHRK